MLSPHVNTEKQRAIPHSFRWFADALNAILPYQHRRFLPMARNPYEAEGPAKFWRRVILATPANFFKHAQLRYRSLDSM
jgi:hypothetical protein